MLSPRPSNHKLKPMGSKGSWQKMPQFTYQSYSSAHFNSCMVNMTFPRKIIVNYYTQISHKFFTFQSHIHILIIIEYHYFREIRKFSLTRSKNDKICFFNIQGWFICLLPIEQLAEFLIYSRLEGLEIFSAYTAFVSSANKKN